MLTAARSTRNFTQSGIRPAQKNVDKNSGARRCTRDRLRYTVLAPLFSCALALKFSSREQGRAQLGNPGRQAFHGNGLHAGLTQGVEHKTMPVVFARELYVGDRSEFGGIARLRGDVLRVIGQEFRVLRRATHGKRMHEPARAVPPITVIQARGITGERKFLYANGFLQAVPDARLLEDLCAPGADIGARARE